LHLWGEGPVGEGVLPGDDVTGLLQGFRHPLPPVRLADAGDVRVGLDLNDIAEEVRAMTARRGQQRRVRQGDGRDLQAGDLQRRRLPRRVGGEDAVEEWGGEQTAGGDLQPLTAWQHHEETPSERRPRVAGTLPPEAASLKRQDTRMVRVCV